MKYIDTVLLEKLIDGDEELLAELAMIFVELFPELRSKLRAGLCENNLENVRVVAHKLRGRLGYFAATQLQQQAAEIESNAKNNRPDQLTQKANDLFDGISEMLNELRQMTQLRLDIVKTSDGPGFHP